MDVILLCFMNWCAVFILIKYILKPKKQQVHTLTKKEYINLCEELTILNSKYNKVYSTIKHIIKRIPFKGEEWEHEYVLEAIDEVMATYNEECNLPSTQNIEGPPPLINVNN